MLRLVLRCVNLIRRYLLTWFVFIFSIELFYRGRLKLLSGHILFSLLIYLQLITVNLKLVKLT
jgi:hypothetical protein